MKKYLPLIIIVSVILLLLVGGFFFWNSRRTGETQSKLESEGVLVETTLAERPYITLTPSNDGHWLTIEVSRIKDADSLEYELLYNTESGATQGSINTVKLEGKSTYSKEILLGSESSGKFKYDEGVSQGTLTLRLRGGPGTRKFITEFHLQQGEDELTSIDGSFIITGTIPQTNFYVTMPTVGLPGEFEGEVIVEPYSTFSSGADTIKNGEVSLELPKGTEKTTLYSWSGMKWVEEEGMIENETISTDISSLTTFIVAAVTETE